MVRVRKKNLTLFLVLFVFFSLVTVVNGTINRVVDEAQLLNTSEVNMLNEKIENLTKETGLDIVLVTTNNTGGKSSRDYADDFYDYNGYGFDEEYSGLLLLINMQEREVWISTTGKGLEYYTDDRIEKISDNIEGYLSDGYYYEACDKFLDEIEKYYSIGIPTGLQKTLERSDFNTTLIIAIIGSLALASISCIFVVINYKNPTKHNGSNYVEQGNVHYTRKDDVFISTHTSKTKIKRDNTSNNRSTHRSSSGRSHGGGGRKF